MPFVSKFINLLKVFLTFLILFSISSCFNIFLVVSLPEGSEIPGLTEETDQMVVSVNAPKAVEEEEPILEDGEEGEEGAAEEGEGSDEETNSEEADSEGSEES